MNASNQHSKYSDFDLVGIALDELEQAAKNWPEDNVYERAHAKAVDALARLEEQLEAKDRQLYELEGKRLLAASSCAGWKSKYDNACEQADAAEALRDQILRDNARLIEQLEALREALEEIAGEDDEPIASAAWYRARAIDAIRPYESSPASRYQSVPVGTNVQVAPEPTGEAEASAPSGRPAPNPATKEDA